MWLFVQRKELEHLRRKLELEEDRLIIRMKKEYEVLKKKMYLHENEIKRVHGLGAKIAWKKGERDGEIRRAKMRARKQNHIIESSKSLRRSENLLPELSSSPHRNCKTDRVRRSAYSEASWTLSPSIFSTRERDNLRDLKQLIKEDGITKFYIRQRNEHELPINVKSTEYGALPSRHKIEKLLIRESDREKLELPSLSKMYDEGLSLLEVRQVPNIN